jgi:nucleotide-binding universal stress UspA family protein
MSYRSIHLHLCVTEEATSLSTIDYACNVARAFAAKLTVSSPRVDVVPPTPWFARSLVGNLEREIEQAAAAKAAEFEAHIRKRAGNLPTPPDIFAVREGWPKGMVDVSVHGRTSDLCIVDLPRGEVDARPYVEDWLFGSGRPCILHPTSRVNADFKADAVALAWDASRSAARAVSDALPILARARKVTALVVRGEKEIVAPSPLERLRDWLGSHGVVVDVQEVALAGRRIGSAILETTAASGADLLVMGAFGHARQRDFILGGATTQILREAGVPLLMSH